MADKKPDKKNDKKGEQGDRTPEFVPESPVTESQARNAFATFEQMLATWGIAMTPEVRAFLKKAVQQRWSSALFLNELHRTKFYADAFPGIMRKDGTQRMSEAQYLSYSNQIKDLGGTLGMHIGKAQVGVMVAQGISANEARQRLTALDRMRSNRTVLNNFAEFLTAKGLAPKKGISRKDLFNFVMRQGPAEWEREWDSAYSSAQLQNIGIDVGRPKTGSDISWDNLGKLVKRFESLNPGQDVANLGQDFYQGIAQNLLALEPAKLYQIGLNKRDILKLAYGDPEAGDIAMRVKRAIGTYRARFEDPAAQNQLINTGTGSRLLTGGTGGAGTE